MARQRYADTSVRRGSEGAAGEGTPTVAHGYAMSAACEARNVPGLQWVLMGENWHNNHHAAPTSASTWVEWYQVDGVYILIRCLELVGLAHNVKVEVPMKREGFVYSGWEFPIQISTQLLFFWLWWHFYLRHYYFTGGAGNASGVEMAAAMPSCVVARTRVTERRRLYSSR